MFEPIFSLDRALILRSKRLRILVVADLHIGIEHEIYKDGISIPSQASVMKKRIEKLISEYKAKKLVLLGDVKHNIPLPSRQELREVPEFIKYFSQKLPVTIVKGNHDGDIEEFVKGVEIKKDLKIENIGLAHGHAWISKELLSCEYLILAHEHPAIEFRDRLGYRSIEHCWLICKPKKKDFEEKYGEKCRIKKVIVMPAFNLIVGGMVFNKTDFSPLGPNFKFLEWKNAEVFLIDGTYLGKLKNLIL
jgi:hypothetical protein